ncbi:MULTISPECIES: cupin domain-containing protein [unclassified Streptomyces]|uniref:cupin domain-containing protein n=1 Tax=unclassified Streptomyces TaxID=2593676 RepID=UPI0022598B8E|nr:MULTISPECIES: cupin domain-containing protein [unclassified Streptomyces]MCX4791665.1 cupin domain-containing protein [Streptomyces sp. NBC_01221]MCX4792710.1 cupin domain-containing protein [Streptomyces sp. NBC_01242]WSP60637.1 cupin domain-containing protein [Streptomyces sp. NBC_01240]WSU19708.1 cupin domain-containing protein [Streptomyces sp. NBC_01108]
MSTDDHAPASPAPPRNDGIGQHLRRERLERGFTLEKLAEKTGLSRSYLSNVERDVNSPTINTLRTIVDALGTTLSQLFHAIDRERRVLTRPDQRVELTRAGVEGVTYTLLNPKHGGKLEMMTLEVAPGASSGDNPHSHSGEEVGLLLSGELDYWVDGVRYRLQPGDCVSFDSSVPHRYSNPGDVPAVCVWSETPPGF